MSKRRNGREINELTTNVLTGLSVEERIGLAMVAVAEGRESWLDTITESFRAIETDGDWLDRIGPAADARTDRLRFENGYAMASGLALQVDSKFRLLWAQYQQAFQAGSVAMLIRLVDGPTTADPPAPDAITVLTKLAVTYRVARRFAEEHLGIELGAWLAVAPGGRTLVETVETLLIDERLAVEIGEDRLAAELDEQGQSKEAIAADSVDELVDVFYGDLVEAWEGTATNE